MAQVDDAKYLGDWLSCEGLSDSVATTRDWVWQGLPYMK